MTRVDSNPVEEAVRKLTLDEKLELLQRLRAGELANPALVSAVIVVVEAGESG